MKYLSILIVTATQVLGEVQTWFDLKGRSVQGEIINYEEQDTIPTYVIIDTSNVIHKWANVRGQVIEAKYISLYGEDLKIEMQGKQYVVKLRTLTRQAQDLAKWLKARGQTTKLDIGNLHAESRRVAEQFINTKKREKEARLLEEQKKAEEQLQRLNRLKEQAGSNWREVSSSRIENRGGSWSHEFRKAWNLRYYHGGGLWCLEGETAGFTGVGREFHKSGTLETEVVFLEGKIQSWKEYYKDGSKLLEVPWVDNKRHGTAIGYHADGSKRWENPYVNGKKHGTAIEYHEDGSKEKETPYVEGKRHGTEIWHSIRGHKFSEIPFVNGNRHGTEIKYREDGSKYWEIVYENGKKIYEKRSVRYKDGSKMYESVFENGKEISTKEF